MSTSTTDMATLPARSLFHLAFHVTDLDEARRFVAERTEERCAA